MMRFLDWLDESAAGVIRVAYLLAGVIAVASYFSDGHVPSGLTHLLDAILPWALACALEVHTYLSARRVRRAYQDKTAAAIGSDEYERAEQSMRVNLWILAGLLSFSMYNQLQYLASTWTPPHTPLTPPGPLAYIVRAVVTPAAFMAAAFLAPIGEGLAAQVQSEAHRLAAATFKVASAQWKRRLREMERQGQDVTGALVHLVDDPTERRVIETIYNAMHPERSVTPDPAEDFAQIQQPEAQAENTAEDFRPDKPPTGGGSPAQARKSSARRVRTPDTRVLELPAPERRRTAARASAGGANTRRVRTASVEAKARAAWQPGMSVGQLERSAGISRNSAAKWRAVLEAEAAQVAQ